MHPQAGHSRPRLDAGSLLLAGLTIYRLLLCSSDSRIRWRTGAALTSVPGNTAPWIEAATAQPTRQSNQWLSGLRTGSGTNVWLSEVGRHVENGDLARVTPRARVQRPHPIVADHPAVGHADVGDVE